MLLEAHAKTYKEGDKVPLSVRALTFGGNSRDEKLYLYPVSYYNKTLGNCSPLPQGSKNNTRIITRDPVFGNHYYSAPMNASFLEDKSCELSCDKRYKEANVTLINDLIKKNYLLNFYIGDIPVGRELYDSQTSKFYIDTGIPMGYLDMDKVPHLFNHFQFVVYYTSQGLDYNLLYATLGTQSLTRIPQVTLACHLTPPLVLRYSDFAYNGNRITYDIVWKEVQVSHQDQITTSDIYKNDVVRPFISNSILATFFLLTGIIFAYTYYTTKPVVTSDKLHVIHKKREATSIGSSKPSTASSGPTIDSPETLESYIDESLDLSWPSLINDVFRASKLSPCLYTLIGQGAHFTVFGLLVILQLATGALKVDGKDNEFLYGIFTLFSLTAVVPGFVNAFLFKTFEKKTASTASTYTLKLVLSVALNAFALPLIADILTSKLNSVHKSVNSPIRISSDVFHANARNYILFTTLTYAISFFFLKVETYHVSDIEKKIAPLPITFKTVPNMLITGLFPFGIVLIPLSTLYLSLWYNHFFSCNGLLFNAILLVTILATISVLNIYHSLAVGNWKWQWYSFLSGSSIGAYSFGYSFYLTNFQFGDHASYVIFLLQNITISTILALVGGSIAYVSSLFFVRKLYADLN